MALANQQDIPNRPEVKEPWTFKRLFPFSGAVTSISKVFINPLEVLLGWVVFVIGVAVLFGRPVPVLFYGLSGCLLAVVAYEILTRPVPPEPKEKKPKVTPTLI